MGEEDKATQEEEVFKCEECGREFDSARGLAVHSRVHDEEPEEEPKKAKDLPYIRHN